MKETVLFWLFHSARLVSVVGAVIAFIILVTNDVDAISPFAYFGYALFSAFVMCASKLKPRPENEDKASK